MFVLPALVYFAFPKCASEWMRYQLNLQWNNIHGDGWDDCDIQYCHVRPSRFVQYHALTGGVTLVSIVRNTYDRLHSSYAYARHMGMSYAKGSFKEFVQIIFDHRGDLLSLPFAWMYLPVDLYFEGVLDRTHFFQLEQLDSVAQFLGEHGIAVDLHRVNVTPNRREYRLDYDEEMIRQVQEVYAYELQRFGYTF